MTIEFETAYQFVGVLGFALYVVNYLLLTTRVLTSDDIIYFVFNALAATLVLISLTANFNLASLLIQLFWIVISAVAIFMRLSRRRRVRAEFQHAS